jgi:hypothetical protein
VIAVRKYGPIFLDKEENRRRRREIETEYHRVLGESVLRRRPKAFWDFQRHALSRIGEQLHWLKLTVWAFVALLDLVLNPKQTAERLLRYKGNSADKDFHKIEQYFDLNQDPSNYCGGV